VGTKVDLLVSRQGQQRTFSLTLDKMPRDYERPQEQPEEP
jgi:hypothetical protein